MPEGAVLVTVAITRIAEASTGRKNLRIFSLSTNAQTLYIKSSKLVATTGPDAGIPLEPAQFMDVIRKEDADIDEAWYAVTAAANATVHVREAF